MSNGLTGLFYVFALLPASLFGISSITAGAAAWWVGGMPMSLVLFALAAAAVVTVVLAAPPWFQLVAAADRSAEALLERSRPANVPFALRTTRVLASRAGDERAEALLDSIGHRLGELQTRRTELERHAAADKAAGLPVDDKLAAHALALRAEEERLHGASRALRDALLFEGPATSDDLVAAARAHAEVSLP